MILDVVIIGAGVIGLACARECARLGLATLVVERHSSFGQETSSRNSEVLHSGIYYSPGSLKAKLCVAANLQLYDECRRLGVWARQCGKLIVAVTEEEEPDLAALHKRGQENGVQGMEVLDARQVAKLEPHIRCRSALFLRRTGILDSHEMMRAFLREAHDHGAEVAYGIEFMNGEQRSDHLSLQLREHGKDIVDLESRWVINAAGLSCDTVAAGFGIDIDVAGYRLHHNRGHYYAVSPAKSKLVSHLVYPMPNKHLVGAGIHITIDRAGQLKLGPDTEYLSDGLTPAEWYSFDDSRKERFFDAVVRYFPKLELSDLHPDQIGVRPKLKGSETTLKDFIIAHEREKGLPSLINLIGIESPGLTCAAEIARIVSSIISTN